MSNQGLWIIDPKTNEERFVYYHELEDEVVQAFIKPIGGFIFPANLFCLSRLPSAPFFVQDWLPKRGKCLLYAPSKSGKSFLCNQLARCIGAGEEFLGKLTTRGRVLTIQFELGEEILQDRLQKTGKDYDNVFVGTSFSMKLDSKVGQKQLWSALEAVKPNVLILDPKIKMITGDENESHEMQPICDFLDTVIEGFGCSIFITDHAGKDPTKRGRGSTIWEGWVDSYLKMKRTSKKGEPLCVEIEPEFLRHASLPPEPVKAKLGEDFEFHLIGSVQTIKQSVEDVLEVSSVVTPKDLFDLHLGSSTSVYKALEELVNEGKVNKVERGIYKWLGK